MRELGLVAIAASLLALQDPPQPPAKFKSGVDIVVLDVTVLDDKRQPVRGLTAADFSVFEDGKPQPIVSFEELHAPDPDGSLVPWMREVAPDVRTNTADDRRIIVLVLDDANAYFDQTGTVKQIGRQIIDRLGPADQLSVVYTGNNQKSQEFTSDRRVLRAAIERYADTSVIPRGFGGSDLPGQYAVQTVRRASETLAALPNRRKAMIFVSTLAINLSDHNTDTGFQLRGALEAAQSANITIFPINPAGLEVDTDVSGAAAGVGGRTLRTASLGSTRDLVNETARIMANDTGGFAINNTNAFDEGIRDIFRQTGSYYLIGYRSGVSDDRYRRVEVKTSRAGVTARTRTGFIGPTKAERKRREQLPLVRSVSGVLPAPDIPLRVTLAPFAGAKRDLASVAIVVGVQQPAPDERRIEKIELVTHAFDVGTQSYRLRATFTQKGQIVLRPSEAGGDAKYEILSKVDLPPGRYQLRFGLQSDLLQKTGSVFQDVEIPDYRKLPLSLSGIALGVTPALPSSPKGYLREVVPIDPTSQRNFAPTDTASVFLRVYQGGRKPLLPANVTATIIDSTDREVHRTDAPLAAETFGAGRSGDVHVDLPLSRLEPGPYLLRVRATADIHEAVREVRFFVRPAVVGPAAAPQRPPLR